MKDFGRLGWCCTIILLTGFVLWYSNHSYQDELRDALLMKADDLAFDISLAEPMLDNSCKPYTAFSLIWESSSAVRCADLIVSVPWLYKAKEEPSQKTIVEIKHNGRPRKAAHLRERIPEKEPRQNLGQATRLVPTEPRTLSGLQERMEGQKSHLQYEQRRNANYLRGQSSYRKETTQHSTVVCKLSLDQNSK